MIDRKGDLGIVDWIERVSNRWVWNPAMRIDVQTIHPTVRKTPSILPCKKIYKKKEDGHRVGTCWRTVGRIHPPTVHERVCLWEEGFEKGPSVIRSRIGP